MDRVALRRQLGLSFVIGSVGFLVALFYVPLLWQTHLAVFLFLVMLSTLLEAMPIPLRQGLSSLLPVVPIGAVVVYHTAPVMWAVVVAGIIAPAFQKQFNWVTSYFNAGQYALSVFFMARTLLLFHVQTNDGITGHLILGVIVSALVFLVFNHLFINLLHFARGTFLVSVMWSALFTEIANMAVCLPFAFLTIALGPVHPLTAPIAFLPIVILAYMLRVHRQTRELQMIHAATTRLASEFDIHAIALETARITKLITLADAVVVFFLDRDRQVLIPEVVYPDTRAASFSKDGYPESRGGVIWRTIRHREYVNIPDTRRDKRVIFDGDIPVFLSMAISPMHAHLEVQGAIVCYAERPHAFGYSMPFVAALANQVSVLFENARLYQELQERTRRDAATGLYNYRFFYEELSKRVTDSVQKKRPVSVVIVDIDFFKKFNDTYGHLAGDAVLRDVGRLLSNLGGSDAIAARYGGEEFALLLPCGRQAAFETAERLREAVRQLTVQFQGYKLQGITVSIGVASCPDDSENDRDLLLKADSAMYWGAKQRGRNRTAMYTPEFDAQLFVDDLTGLYTVHLVNIRVRDDVLHGSTEWGAICIDLNQFGSINSTFGFDVGDQVLRQTGVIIRECMRHGELACRYGGDEILILLPGVGESELAGVQERVTRSIASHRYTVGENIILSLRVRATHSILKDVVDGADLFNRVADLFAELDTESGKSMA
ncbi:sensor domain-containing diguanylate cyclase [Alicyclobacillus dauci]|uniref:Sensor domain-containing diguanylate cyclase n=1 Tax=Alicyclobacillus dauci TaxID=1475485 RepID=A0ABY6Z857_9BACL|nr:sensor domain-containing diguanylate cyclase [Alicyclobacillus dauci]WAH38429.1 sensor domain-containing diguanylate cyclase [Alicyclobacillus dauci]